MQELQPAIASALEYIELKPPPRFIPARPGELNRLEVSLHALPRMTLPPCRAKLTIPPDKELFADLLEPQGTQEVELEPGGKAQTLSAKGIKLNPSATKEEGLFHLSIDGLDRVLWFKTQFAIEGETRIATLYDVPRVRFEATRVVKNDQPAKLVVAFTVDNAPADARLELHLGQNKEGQLVDGVTKFRGAAKQQHIGFDPAGPDGALQFEASVRDWKPEFVTSRIRGQMKLRATLFDPRTHKEFDKWEQDLILDDVIPENAVVEVAPKVPKGTARLQVSATVDPPASGIADVGFIVGSKEAFAKPDVKPVAGKRKGIDDGAWEATLPLPPDATGSIVITARFRSGVDLTTFNSVEVGIIEPEPSPDEVAAAKPQPKKPGGIKGKVTENDIAQPGLDVYLSDPKEKDAEKQVKQKVATKPDGTYEFPKLDPGLYQVVCLKRITGRWDKKEVTVPSGEIVTQDLDLILH